MYTHPIDERWLAQNNWLCDPTGEFAGLILQVIDKPPDESTAQPSGDHIVVILFFGVEVPKLIARMGWEAYAMKNPNVVELPWAQVQLLRRIQPFVSTEAVAAIPAVVEESGGRTVKNLSGSRPPVEPAVANDGDER